MPALDALRGLAVIGIAWMNVIAFAMPGAAYVNPRAYGGTALADIASWATGLRDGRGQVPRAVRYHVRRRGDDPARHGRGPHRLRGHYARMAVLFAIGWLHAPLLASNDILRVYAIAGLLLPLRSRLVHSRRLLWSAAALIAAQLALASVRLLEPARGMAGAVAGSRCRISSSTRCSGSIPRRSPARSNSCAKAWASGSRAAPGPSRG